MVGVRALCGCFVFLLVAVMLLGELDFVTEHIGEPPARRVVDSVLLRSIIDSAWVDRPEQQLLTLRPPDRVRTNVQQEYPPSNTTILAFVNSGYWPWVEHLLNNVAALGLSQHLLVVAEDRPCFNNLRRRGVRAQLAAGEGSGSGGKLLPYNSKAYKSLVHLMPRQVLRLLRSGQAVFLLDADVTLLANPLEYLAPTGYDLYVQDDFREVGARINGGFFFARPTPGAQQVFEDITSTSTRTFTTSPPSTGPCGATGTACASRCSTRSTSLTASQCFSSRRCASFPSRCTTTGPSRRRTSYGEPWRADCWRNGRIWTRC